MGVRFPLHCGRHTQEGEDPMIGIFDDAGYWFQIAGAGTIEMKPTVRNIDRMDAIVKSLNAVYYLGREDAQKDIREALGIEDD